MTRIYDLRDWPYASWRQQPRKPMNAGEIPGTRSEAEEEMAYALMESLAPETWRENGGVPGSICFVAERMIVTQTWRNHEKFRRFLDAMRSAPPAPAANPATTAPASRPSN